MSMHALGMHAYRFSTTKPFMFALKHTNTVLALYCIQNFAVIHERGAYIRLAVIIVYIVCYRRDSMEYSALPPPFHPPRPSDQRTRSPVRRCRRTFFDSMRGHDDLAGVKLCVCVGVHGLTHAQRV